MLLYAILYVKVPVQKKKTLNYSKFVKINFFVFFENKF